jgi:CDP-paratose 2-epimerase
VLESIALVEKETGRKIDHHFVAENRKGDHICYISDLGKLRSHYPEWTIERDLGTICGELVAAERLLWKDGEAPARKA